ncbi:hypothetical protein WBG78_27565 [Chryseolinea sp. T2]|uniref:hypothetical protein n=1 Tax=Chryseolinea sp. T2 TaxID=3129255 RepID=UPI003077A8FF
MAIAKVRYGPFIEYIPQTGEVIADSVRGFSVLAEIDELYITRITEGLIATTTLENRDYELQIDQVSHEVVEGRFEIRLCFKDTVPPAAQPSKHLRLRVQLGGTSDRLLLPVGGFYKDTGGKWVFVMEGKDKAVRRSIVLGRKMGSEYFEVLDGLKEGEQVITSSYENFMDHETLDSADIAHGEPRILHM